MSKSWRKRSLCTGLLSINESMALFAMKSIVQCLLSYRQSNYWPIIVLQICLESIPLLPYFCLLTKIIYKLIYLQISYIERVGLKDPNVRPKRLHPVIDGVYYLLL